MAEDPEQSLDDFFAKKDKGKKTKKKKKVKTFETTAETQIGEVETNKVKDEWKDFEEEKEKDYSNLKIQDLQVTDDVMKEEEEQEEEDADDIDGGPKKPKSDKTSIWSESTPSSAVPQKEVLQPSLENVVGGKYVSPGLKRTLGQPRRRIGAPPDISSQTLFPTLCAASQDPTSEKVPTDFEVVKKGSRNTRYTDSHPALDLDNRYEGLRS